MTYRLRSTIEPLHRKAVNLLDVHEDWSFDPNAVRADT
jgi:hypothetical protein